MDPFEELDHEENLWDFDTRPTYLQEAVDTDLFTDIRKKILPAKAEEVAKVFSTVIPGDQVDTELCSKSREKIFEERKDTTLSGKLIKDPPVRGQFGEAFIELREGYKAKKQRPYENHGHKHEILRKIIERNLREFGWLEGCMTSEWCCAPFTVPKLPPADQNTIDGWRMVVDFRNLNAETKADSHPLPLIEEEIAKKARGAGSPSRLSPNAVEEGQPTSHLYVHAMWPSPVDGHAHGPEERPFVFSKNDGGCAFLGSS